MKIAVLVKQVPDTDEVKMDPEKGTMVREGVGAIMNPLDMNALEAALALKRGAGDGEVTVLSMGPPQTEEALREAIALGADKALLLTDRAFAGADTWATSRVLAEAIRKTGPFDLILAGEKATDGETGQVGPEVAAMLDLPFSTYVSALERISPTEIRVRRTIEEGYQYQILSFPCLLTVLSDLNEPSMPTLAGKKKARRFSLETAGNEALDLPKEELGLSGSPTRVVRISYPKITRNTEHFSGSRLDEGIEHVVTLLKEQALL